MLNDLRNSYAEIAQSRLGDSWQDLNKNECIRGFCECEDDIKSQGYLAAAMVKYWHLIDSYTMQGSGAYDAETVYDWLTHCMQYAKKQQPWKKGGNLAGQENGPDKAMNIYMKSMRQGFYQWSNSKKRAAEFTQSLSLDRMIEETGDANLLDCADTSQELVPEILEIKKLVKNTFDSKNYMSSFIIDGIINASVFDVETGQDNLSYMVFNKRKLSKHLRNLDDDYCHLFAKSYELDINNVLEARNDCSKLSSTRIYTLIKHTLAKLSKDPLFALDK